jgi:deferrochelatase/peroxidase EfeB
VTRSAPPSHGAIAGGVDPARIDPADVQGWVAKGYTHRFVRHVVVEVGHARTARRFVGAVTGDDRSLPQVTDGARWATRDERPTVTVNVGFTHVGLRALDIPADAAASFPSDFRSGVVARAAKIGDVGASAPDRWAGRLGEPDVVHAILTVHADLAADLDATTDVLLGAARGGFGEVSRFDGAAFPDGVVHFGYRDGIAQPRVQGLREDAQPDGQPLLPTGGLVLGHPSQFENVVFTVPRPDALGRNGTYNAFRVLAQDVVAFDRFLAESAAALGTDADTVAAKLLGRWPNGNPLTLCPVAAGEPLPIERINDYGYADDPAGTVCPIGSHMRRANPRDGKVVQRGFGHSRRIVRRGIPYGPQWSAADGDDGVERGLLGNFMCGSLTAQFEAIMFDWINLGLHHPDVTGLNDPILGANDPATSRFDIPGEQPRELTGFGRFVTTRGSAYTFIPSIAALRYLAAG